MNKPLNPVAMIGIIALAVVALAVFGWQATRPAAYSPSPGVVNGRTPGNPNAAASPTTTNAYYPGPPAGTMPGRPAGH